jgi:hypothetical protein
MNIWVGRFDFELSHIFIRWHHITEEYTCIIFIGDMAPPMNIGGAGLTGHPNRFSISLHAHPSRHLSHLRPRLICALSLPGIPSSLTSRVPAPPPWDTTTQCFFYFLINVFRLFRVIFNIFRFNICAIFSVFRFSISVVFRLFRLILFS